MNGWMNGWMNGSINIRPFRRLVKQLTFDMKFTEYVPQDETIRCSWSKYGKGCPWQGQDWQGDIQNYFSCMIYSSTEKWTLTAAVIMAHDGVVINNRTFEAPPIANKRRWAWLRPGFSWPTLLEAAARVWHQLVLGVSPDPWWQQGQRSCSRSTASDPSAYTWCTTRGEEARCWGCWGAGSRGEGWTTAMWGSSTTSALSQCVCQALRSIILFQCLSLSKTLGESWLDNKRGIVEACL